MTGAGRDEQLGLNERGFVSDTTSGAMVAADGTVDWWCPGRFDADPVFTRLLDPAGAGVRVGPPGRVGGGPQGYVDGTMVLATRLAGRESLVEVTDFMPWDGGAGAGRVVRIVEVLRGPTSVVVEVVPGGDRRDVSVWSEGVRFTGGVVQCPLPFTLSNGPPLTASASAVLDSGDRLVVTIGDGPPLSPDAAAASLVRTETAWRRVWNAIALEGPYDEAVARSLLVLTALAGGGAPVDSPTTSLPRVIGGERNADGRVVRPFVAAGWSGVAAASGLFEQSDAAGAWLAGALGEAPPLPPVLSVDGGAPRSEAHLSHLPGWGRSQPVVIGSDAADRPSVEAIAAVLRTVREGPILSAWDRVVAHADWLADNWAAPDATMWDLLRPARESVPPRLSARAALASVSADARRRHPLDLDAVGWSTAARDIERWLASSGVSTAGALLGSDAALTRVAWLGPWPADDPVVRATVAGVISRNGDGGWVHPLPEDVDDGRPGTEPPSVAASLWVARALALMGQTDEAHERLEAAIGLAGPLHLLPEAVDPVVGAPLGNRPAAGAHLAFVEAVRALGPT